MSLEVFVPGKLINPLNNRRGWRAVWATSKAARLRTWMAFSDYYLQGHRSTDPKHVRFLAHVAAEWDDDNLRAALKPHRDGLRDALVIQDDKPSAGHTFDYYQRIDRTRHRREPGVTITVELAVHAAGVPR